MEENIHNTISYKRPLSIIYKTVTMEKEFHWQILFKKYEMQIAIKQMKRCLHN